MKRVIVLVGLKGAGKSTIGQIIETRFGIPFIRVEPVYLQVRSTLGASHPDLERQGFQAILDSLIEALSQHDALCFETTGASRYTSWLLAELSKVAEVLPVRVLVEPAQCLQRIHSRDASIHIPVSDADIQRINAVAAQVDVPWAAIIDNHADLDRGAIVATISALLNDSKHGLANA